MKKKLLYFVVLFFPATAFGQVCNQLSDEYYLWAETEFDSEAFFPKGLETNAADPFPSEYRATEEIYEGFRNTNSFKKKGAMPPKAEQLKEKYPNLNIEEIVVLYDYSKYFFKYINGILRNKNLSEIKEEMDYIHILVSALNKLPTYPAKTIRYADYRPEKINQHRTAAISGDTVIEKSFLSTSVKPEYFWPYPHNVKLLINSFSGVQIKDFSYVSIEDEVLLKPYRKFKVLKVVEKDNAESGKIEIYLEEVP